MPSTLIGLLQATYLQWMTTALLAGCLYGAALIFYRLYLHPLRKVPGPRLAAMTYWVETYYECFKQPGGQFMWQYQKWHDQYGPIVRITPNEVHIQDPYFYDSLYNQSRHLLKLRHLENRFNNRLSAFATTEHEVHRMRRSALNPFFSKKKISEFAPDIQLHMDRLCERVQTDFTCNGSVLNANAMWSAFTSDIVVEYCLERPYNFIQNPVFHADFSDAMSAFPSPIGFYRTIQLTLHRSILLDGVHIFTQFRWLADAMLLLPDWITIILLPPMKSFLHYRNEMRQQIMELKAAHAAGKLSFDKRTSLFTAMLNSDLPTRELSTMRLQHEAMAIIGAGIETTMFTLATCTYHVLENPNILSLLKNELQAAIPDPADMPNLDTLMQLPYLTCLINEALRLSYGVSQRIPRLSPTALAYVTPESEYIIPAGSVISMDNYSMAHDVSIFPRPRAFDPERWAGLALAPDGKPLTKYLVTFGRGTRSCLGMQLAYAELYIGIATFFRRFECELYDTQCDAVECFKDAFVPRPKPGTQGVRLKVTRAH